MIRIFDFTFALVGFLAALPLLLIVMIVGVFDTGSPLFFQKRLGIDQRKFTLIKIRTMKVSTNSVASHLVDRSSITPFGSFLRKYKLDELPQLINVIRGELSLVGPRPCLPTQSELIKEREKNGIFSIKPGITGLAQIRNVDMSDPTRLVKEEVKMISEWSLSMYFKLILKTASGQGAGDAVA